MTAGKCRPCVAVAAIFFIGVLANLRAAEPEWLKIDDGDFVIYTDATEKVAMKSAVQFAAYRAAFRQLLLAPGENPPESVLFIFRKKEGLREYSPPDDKKDGKELLNYSIVVDGTEVNAFSSSYNAEKALADTIEFETTWMMPRVGFFAPLWAKQGAGKVFATTALKKGKWTVGAELDSSFRYSWKELFGFGRTSEEYSGSDNSDYHEQIWGLMHWMLLTEGDARARFVRLTRELPGSEAVDVLPAIMDTPLDDFRQAIRQHYGHSRARVVDFDEAAFRSRVRVGPAPRAEILVWTGELLDSIGKDLRASDNLDEALKIAPDSAVVQEAWARKLNADGRYDEATIAYRKAIAAGSRDYVSYLSSGAAYMREAHLSANRSGHPAGGGGVEAAKALEQLRQAVLLNHESQEALRQFGRALFYSKEMTDSDVALLRERVLPGQEGAPARAELALVESRIDPDKGRAILEEIIGDPKVGISNRSTAKSLLEFLSATKR